MDRQLQALVEPRRRDILTLVYGRELKAGDIASHFAVSRPAISQHIQVLKQAGLLSERRAGTARYYRARPEGLADVREFIERFWTSRLQVLKRLAEAEERGMSGDG